VLPVIIGIVLDALLINSLFRRW